MQIDNSGASTYKTCPWKYYEAYVRKVEPVPVGETYGPLDFGTRMHELLEEHYKGELLYKPSDNDMLEMEAQMMIEAYKAKYPSEEWELVDCERPFAVGLPDYCPKCYSIEVKWWHRNVELNENFLHCQKCNHMFYTGRHQATGKIDIVYRSKENGRLNIMDHKTEKRGAKSNFPQKWAAKDQASIYMWAAERIYGEKPENFYVNVLTRQSPAGQIGPTFPERQKIERPQADIDIAVRDLVYWADKIDEAKRMFGDEPWPANRDNCYTWSNCEYWQLHRYGEDVSEILKYKYVEKKEYLNLGGVKIIQ